MEGIRPCDQFNRPWLRDVKKRFLILFCRGFRHISGLFGCPGFLFSSIFLAQGVHCLQPTVCFAFVPNERLAAPKGRSPCPVPFSAQ